MGFSCRQQFTVATRDWLMSKGIAQDPTDHNKKAKVIFSADRYFVGRVGCLLPPCVATGLGAAGRRGAVAGRIPISPLGHARESDDGDNVSERERQKRFG